MGCADLAQVRGKGIHAAMSVEIIVHRHDIIKEGWLVKQSKHVKQWRRRWLVLTPQYLCSFRTQGETRNATEAIRIRECSSVLSADGDTGKENSFRVDTPGRVFYLISEGATDKESWIGIIGRQMVRPTVLADDECSPIMPWDGGIAQAAPATAGNLSVFCAVSIPIALGMDGGEAVVHIEEHTSFESLLKDVTKMQGRIAAADTGVQLSSAGVLINSLEALLGHHNAGDVVYATFIRDVDRMSLESVAEELTCNADEFKGHQFTLSKIPPHFTARHVAHYLWEHQVLLTSVQAQTLFDQLVAKLGDGMRRDLVMALHSFCLHQHHVWEPDDGTDECLWAAMTWGGHHLQFKDRRLTRGRLSKWECADAIDPSSEDTWPSIDLCNLRGVAKARRAQQSKPLDAMRFVRQYEQSWTPGQSWRDLSRSRH